MNKFISIIIVVFICFTVSVQAENIEINDKNLDNCIKKRLKIKEKYNVVDILKLNCENMSIESLKGLESLTNLKEINLSGNKIMNFGGLNELKKLERLNISNNDLEGLKGLESMSQLIELWASENKIKEVEGIKSLINLKKLVLNKNKITSIDPLKGLNKLEKLWLDNNNIEHINVLSGLSNLSILSLGANKIAEANSMKSLKKLKTLDISSNSLRNIPILESNESLEILDMSDNKINKITSTEQLKNLKAIYLDNNNLASGIDILLKNKQLETISIKGNLLKRINFDSSSFVTRLFSKLFAKEEKNSTEKVQKTIDITGNCIQDFPSKVIEEKFKVTLRGKEKQKEKCK